MAELLKTILCDEHTALGAKMVEFGGWLMPVNYPAGIIKEHLATRKHAGLFDVSHMGRFIVRGKDTLPFLQHVLSNNAASLNVSMSQYTLIPSPSGGAVDDAYLYRFVEGEYLLVVNASNRQKDWAHFKEQQKQFGDVELTDCTNDLAMISLQGPDARSILGGVLSSGSLPEPLRNALSTGNIGSTDVMIARTGYTGEPLCFELIMPSDDAVALWKLLIHKGSLPVGLGARDTLRLEAGLPLYGHEFGTDMNGCEIQIFSCPVARPAVSFSPLKGDFVGREALKKQFDAYKKIREGDFSQQDDLPLIGVKLAPAPNCIARGKETVFRNGNAAGYVTSGTMVPYWKSAGQGLSKKMTEETGLRPVCMALVSSNTAMAERLEIEIRGKKAAALVVPYHLRSETPPYTWPILHGAEWQKGVGAAAKTGFKEKALELLNTALANTEWRQQECVNLIPSEMTPSALCRLLSVMDPAGRYAEHNRVKAFFNAEVFYYQGTNFIAGVERLLEAEFEAFLGCREAETRLISGQMANTAVFSAIVDFLNRADRRHEPRRMRHVMANHLIKGGHLSAQPMGALRDFVARDPVTEQPAVVNFPVQKENPYRIDVAACEPLLEKYRPELIIFGKSVVLHPEPVGPVRAMVKALCPNAVIMYDMAHVLGLAGPHFQEPFKDGADLVTGSTHKTFFGTQRGVVATSITEDDTRYQLWEAIRRRTFPGSVSNHHLGTLLGLLFAAYEMNHFKDEYQKKVILNAKAFAAALKATGLNVAGDPEVSFTETHQVIVHVGYSNGPGVAQRLEENNIIVNFQAGPYEESFSASGALRMGVAEMTRFGMEKRDFEELALLVHAVIAKQQNVKGEIRAFRKRFANMRYCFSEKEFESVAGKLKQFI